MWCHLPALGPQQPPPSTFGVVPEHSLLGVGCFQWIMKRKRAGTIWAWIRRPGKQPNQNGFFPLSAIAYLSSPELPSPSTSLLSLSSWLSSPPSACCRMLRELDRTKLPPPLLSWESSKCFNGPDCEWGEQPKLKLKKGWLQSIYNLRFWIGIAKDAPQTSRRTWSCSAGADVQLAPRMYPKRKMALAVGTVPERAFILFIFKCLNQ